MASGDNAVFGTRKYEQIKMNKNYILFNFYLILPDLSSSSI